MLVTSELIPPTRLDPRARRLIPKLSFAGAVADLDPVEVRRKYNRAREPFAWPLERVGNITSIARGGDGTPALKIPARHRRERAAGKLSLLPWRWLDPR